ncbi:hypothetical protein N7508_001641 [Penicillium antarcticum]|uniref:uncharacterized protein n=1 Tax=Penicillium antarcticum TaxID=416450 RepID=UPI002396B43E|nr:uncharacterized protein N7508_001641 [Penicillium antarcticum]KAJ5317133.1 hypothetical protein N7508_001641 [Penicillium antarcticum]
MTLELSSDSPKPSSSDMAATGMSFVEASKKSFMSWSLATPSQARFHTRWGMFSHEVFCSFDGSCSLNGVP